MENLQSGVFSSAPILIADAKPETVNEVEALASAENGRQLIGWEARGNPRRLKDRLRKCPQRVGHNLHDALEKASSRQRICMHIESPS